MATSPALLALLEQEPAHGYTLKHRYDDLFTPMRPLAYGQVYAALARFERQQLVEVVEIESGGGPDRKRYRITPQGVSRIDAWVSSAQPATSYAASELYAKLSVALMSSRSPESVLDQQRGVHLIRMRELTERQRTAPVAEVLALTFELNHLDADLRWIEEAGQRLGDLRRTSSGGVS